MGSCFGSSPFSYLCTFYLLHPLSQLAIFAIRIVASFIPETEISDFFGDLLDLLFENFYFAGDDFEFFTMRFAAIVRLDELDDARRHVALPFFVEQ